jgi:hypothetical protein
MTKDAYFEMCEMLGSEPVESEIPVELDDFPDLVQQTFYIYSMLADTWDPMGGNYLGKNYSILFDILQLYEYTQQESIFIIELIHEMDAARGELIAQKLKQKTPVKT